MSSMSHVHCMDNEAFKNLSEADKTRKLLSQDLIKDTAIMVYDIFQKRRNILYSVVEDT